MSAKISNSVDSDCSGRSNRNGRKSTHARNMEVTRLKTAKHAYNREVQMFNLARKAHPDYKLPAELKLLVNRALRDKTADLYWCAFKELKAHRFSLPELPQNGRNLLDELEGAAEMQTKGAPSGTTVPNQGKNRKRPRDSTSSDSPNLTGSLPPPSHPRSKSAARKAQHASHVGEARRSKQRHADGSKHVHFAPIPQMTVLQEDTPNTAFRKEATMKFAELHGSLQQLGGSVSELMRMVGSLQPFANFMVASFLKAVLGVSSCSTVIWADLERGALELVEEVPAILRQFRKRKAARRQGRAPGARQLTAWRSWEGNRSSGGVIGVWLNAYGIKTGEANSRLVCPSLWKQEKKAFIGGVEAVARGAGLYIGRAAARPSHGRAVALADLQRKFKMAGSWTFQDYRSIDNVLTWLQTAELQEPPITGSVSELSEVMSMSSAPAAL
ncbi:hypothetical protein VOLCADRAFT_108646 [Volvox carteri f. nagariensis]|uniref:Uncharacterized protein n=1 Tax=Volvox carteri f. nagariensis TaxID=3068 RepID=D8ULI8_VOLCA|nr:uncharacterized protein VOLCADRAFT_108646 [Volvox carteri f. nagariensis]EFJ39412.1 hypothetical protein VOLCADRAFT_108646 [Volvox carteri f. nagariensis]|eukprot:XP_002959524.1 hypothetical protein VOLCADRAFT_108646 [Volvox carteri f. nagariensis]